MKKAIFIALAILISANGFTQLQSQVKTFLSDFQTNYMISKLNDDSQYYRQLNSLKKDINWSTSVELKSQTLSSNENTYYEERYQRIQFYAFEYKESENCDSAFLKLKECFPNDCIKIKEMQNISHKITPSIFIINNNNIICVRTNCEDVNENWEEIIQQVSKKFATSNSKIILTKCGKLTWTTKKELELVK